MSRAPARPQSRDERDGPSSRAPRPPMKIFDAAATRAALPFERLIAALRGAVRERLRGAAPPRARDRGGDGGVDLAVMPAWQPTAATTASRSVNIAPGNAARGLPALHASYLLYDATTGAPLALIDGDEITARRTAAASALAASLLARADARRLLVVGAGAGRAPAARGVPRGAGRSSTVTVWARDPQRGRGARATRCARRGIDAHGKRPTSSRPSAAADIVSCATLGDRAAGRRAAGSRPGSHLDLIGSFTPAMREADDACFAGAAHLRRHRGGAAEERRPARPARRAACSARAEVRGTLAHACAAARRDGRRDARRAHRLQVGRHRARGPRGGDARLGRRHGDEAGRGADRTPQSGEKATRMVRGLIDRPSSITFSSKRIHR